ncbi:Serine active site containing protein 1 [Cichlidogyrus casuarinus]|uniref:Serine active site containing protein 1 n=1 Tax=Cichlidogyrus casuarinus TaxID=1844966 RepID=A0ABD2PYX9_9PLAT
MTQWLVKILKSTPNLMNVRFIAQEWLAKKYPRARVLGINVTLKPFKWTELCPMEKPNREIKARAVNLLPSLAGAQVGQRRPVLWISHSAGGILLKQILYTVAQLDLALRDSLTVEDEKVDDQMPPVFQNLTNECKANPHIASSILSILSSTKLIVFISVPHAGNGSLDILYCKPIRKILTPEAKQLQRHSEHLKTLHTWFLSFARQRRVAILTQAETLKVNIAPGYKNFLVPFDERDREFGEVQHLKKDHVEVCKPKNQGDEGYKGIVDFIDSKLEQIFLKSQ